MKFQKIPESAPKFVINPGLAKSIFPEGSLDHTAFSGSGLRWEEPLIKADPQKPNLGSWEGLPIIAIGPKGGKIVGYDAMNKPIYAGSSKAKKLAAADAKATKDITASVQEWLTEVLGVPAVQSKDGKSVVVSVSNGKMLKEQFGVTAKKVAKSTKVVQFTAKDFVPHIKKPLTPQTDSQQAAFAAKAGSGELDKDPFPPMDELTRETGTSLANQVESTTHGVWLFRDKKGNPYVFKFGSSLISRAEEAADRVARLILGTGKAPAAKHMKLEGKDGVLLTFIEGEILNDANHNAPPTNMLQKHFDDVVAHQVVDWLVSNHDSHAGNFMVNEAGLAAFDKGQAWKFWDKDELSETFSPNYSKPIYVKFWKEFKAGNIKGNPIKAARKAIEAAEKVTKDQFKQIVMPYAIEKAKDQGGDAKKIANQMAARLVNLRHDFEKFLTKALGKKVVLEKEYEDNFETMPESDFVDPDAMGTPAQAPTAPVQTEEVPGWPIKKGAVTIYHPGNPVPSDVTWKKAYPGPGFKSQVTYKGKLYTIEFAVSANKKMTVGVAYPDGSIKTFPSPNAASDSLVLFDKGLDLSMTGTQKKEAGISYPAKTAFGINKFKKELEEAHSADPEEFKEATEPPKIKGTLKPPVPAGGPSVVKPSPDAFPVPQLVMGHLTDMIGTSDWTKSDWKAEIEMDDPGIVYQYTLKDGSVRYAQKMGESEWRISGGLMTWNDADVAKFLFDAEKVKYGTALKEPIPEPTTPTPVPESEWFEATATMSKPSVVGMLTKMNPGTQIRYTSKNGGKFRAEKDDKGNWGIYGDEDDLVGNFDSQLLTNELVQAQKIELASPPPKASPRPKPPSPENWETMPEVPSKTQLTMMGVGTKLKFSSATADYIATKTDTISWDITWDDGKSHQGDKGTAHMAELLQLANDSVKEDEWGDLGQMTVEILPHIPEQYKVDTEEADIEVPDTAPTEYEGPFPPGSTKTVKKKGIGNVTLTALPGGEFEVLFEDKYGSGTFKSLSAASDWVWVNQKGYKTVEEYKEKNNTNKVPSGGGWKFWGIDPKAIVPVPEEVEVADTPEPGTLIEPPATAMLMTSISPELLDEFPVGTKIYGESIAGGWNTYTKQGVNNWISQDGLIWTDYSVAGGLQSDVAEGKVKVELPEAPTTPTAPTKFPYKGKKWVNVPLDQITTQTLVDQPDEGNNHIVWLEDGQKYAISRTAIDWSLVAFAGGGAWTLENEFADPKQALDAINPDPGTGISIEYKNPTLGGPKETPTTPSEPNWEWFDAETKHPTAKSLKEHLQGLDIGDKIRVAKPKGWITVTINHKDFDADDAFTIVTPHNTDPIEVPFDAFYSFFQNKPFQIGGPKKEEPVGPPVPGPDTVAIKEFVTTSGQFFKTPSYKSIAAAPIGTKIKAGEIIWEKVEEERWVKPDGTGKKNTIGMVGEIEYAIDFNEGAFLLPSEETEPKFPNPFGWKVNEATGMISDSPSEKQLKGAPIGTKFKIGASIFTKTGDDGWTRDDGANWASFAIVDEIEDSLAANEDVFLLSLELKPDVPEPQADIQTFKNPFGDAVDETTGMIVSVPKAPDILKSPVGSTIKIGAMTWTKIYKTKWRSEDGDEKGSVGMREAVEDGLNAGMDVKLLSFAPGAPKPQKATKVAKAVLITNPMQVSDSPKANEKMNLNYEQTLEYSKPGAGGVPPGAKSPHWAGWVPPTGVFVEGESGGQKFWLTTNVTGHAEDDGEAFKEVGFTIIDEGGNVSTSHATKSAAAALKTAALNAGIDFGSIGELKNIFKLKGSLFAPGETLQTIIDGTGPSAIPSAGNVLEKPVTQMTDAEKQMFVKAEMTMAQAFMAKFPGQSKIQKSGDGFKLVLTNFPGETSEDTKFKLEGLLSETGFATVMKVQTTPQGAVFPVSSIASMGSLVTVSLPAGDLTGKATPSPDNWETMPEGIPKLIDGDDLGKFSIGAHLEDMPTGAQLVSESGLVVYQKQPDGQFINESGSKIDSDAFAEMTYTQGFTWAVIPPGADIPVQKPKNPKPKYKKPKKTKEQKAKEKKAKEIATWAKNNPPVQTEEALHVLSHFQALNNKVRLWVRTDGKGNLLILNRDPKMKNQFEVMKESIGKSFTTEVKSPMGEFWKISVADLKSNMPGNSADTIVGPDEKTYPAGTTFDTKVTNTVVLDFLMSQKDRVTKITDHKSDPKKQMLKLAGTEDDEGAKLLAVAKEAGLEVDPNDIIVGGNYTMLPVDLKDMEKVHTSTETIIPNVPDQPMPFLAAALPSSGAAIRANDPVELNSGDLAIMDIVSPAATGHSVRIGKPGVFWNNQLRVYRIRKEDGTFEYEVMGQLHDKTKLKNMESDTFEFFSAQGQTYKHSKYKEQSYNPEDGAVSKKKGEDNVLESFSGKTAITGKGSRVDVITASHYPAMDGLFRVRIPSDGDIEEELGQAMESMGINPQEAMVEPTAEDERLFIKYQILRNVGGTKYWRASQAEMRDEKWLDAELKKHNALDLVNQAEIVNGFNSKHVVKIPNQDRAALQGTNYCYMGVNSLQSLYARLRENRGMWSNRTKFMSGTKGGAASLDKDQSVGGTAFSFLRMGNDNADGNGWGYKCEDGLHFIFHPRVLDRTDWIAHSSDKFGSVKGDSVPRDKAFSLTASDHEIDFEDGMNPEDIAGVAVSNEQEKAELIKMLTDDGIKEYNGIPLKDFILVNTTRSRSFVAENCAGLKKGVLE